MLKRVFLLLSLVGMVSCVALRFVGGRPSLKGYTLEASYANALRATDSLAYPNGNLRWVRNGSGYDAGRYRMLYLVTQDIYFDVHFRGDSTSWNRRSETSDLSLDYIKADGTPFNGGVKRTPAEKAQLAAAIRTVEIVFVEPLRSALR